MDLYTFGEVFAPDSDNMGGAWQLRYALVEWVTESPVPVQNRCTEDLTFDNTLDYAEWTPIAFTPDTGDLQEAVITGPNGPQYAYRFTCVVPVVVVGRLQQLHMLQRHRAIYEVQDGNGIWRRLGDLRNPCTMTFDAGTGAGAAARNGITVTITWLNDEVAPFVDLTYVPDFAHLESAS